MPTELGAGLRPAEVGRHGGRPSSFTTNAARQRPAKSLGGRCSVGAHFSRAPARPSRLDGGGAAPRRNRTTRRSSLQFHHKRGAGAPLEIPWRAVLRRRPLFPRDDAALSAGLGAGLRPARVGRHGGRPSSFITSAARERLSKPLRGRWDEVSQRDLTDFFFPAA